MQRSHRANLFYKYKQLLLIAQAHIYMIELRFFKLCLVSYFQESYCQSVIHTGSLTTYAPNSKVPKLEYAHQAKILGPTLFTIALFKVNPSHLHSLR